jgi:RNA polymerase-binding transcription factor DksA
MKTQAFRKRLEEEKAHLEAEMQSVGRKSATVPDDWETAPAEPMVEADPIDQAGVVEARGTEAAILSALEARYDRILAALARIDAGTYGRCEVCSAPIAEARLNAIPSATTCAAHM